MKQNQNNRRARSRGNGKHRSVRGQNFESNGPNVKVRGTAQQVLDKYLALARDASSSGDRIMAEAYFQHAEHYFRILNSDNNQGANAGNGARQRGNGRQTPADNDEASEDEAVEAGDQAASEDGQEGGEQSQGREPRRRNGRRRNGRNRDGEQQAAERGNGDAAGSTAEGASGKGNGSSGETEADVVSAPARAALAKDGESDEASEPA